MRTPAAAISSAAFFVVAPGTFVGLGQAVLFPNVWLVVYAAITWAVTASFVRWYEEPTLVRTYGRQYETYRDNVPTWIPRLTPWTPQH